MVDFNSHVGLYSAAVGGAVNEEEVMDEKVCQYCGKPYVWMCDCEQTTFVDRPSVAAQGTDELRKWLTKCKQDTHPWSPASMAETVEKLLASHDAALKAGVREECVDAPEPAILGAQIAELEARLDQAQAGVKVIQGLRMISPSPIGPLYGAGWNDSIGHAERHLHAHVTDFESQIAALKTQLAKEGK